MRDGWKETTLSDIADVNMGQSPPGDTYNTEGIGMPFMQGSAEFGEHYPEPVKFCSAPAKIAEIGDLLLSVRAPVGDSNFANQRIAIGRGLATVRAKTGANTNFLRLVIQLNTAGLLATSGTGMFSSITGKNLREFGVSLPPLDEQKRIVDVVSSVDVYIDALQQQADSARTARDAVLHELLSAGGDDWTETTLGKIASLKNGDRGKNYPSANQRTSYGVPFINAGHLVNGKVVLDSMDYISEETFNSLSAGKIEENDILYCLRGTVGKFGIIDGINRGAIASSLVILRVGKASMTSFVYLFLDSAYAKMQLGDMRNGAVQPNLSASSLASFKVVLPPLAEQKRIVEIVSSMDELIQSTEQAVIEAKNLRSGLLSDLLSGENEIPASYDSLLGAA